MIISASGAAHANTFPSFGLAQPSPSASMDSFTQSLMTAIEGYLDKSAGGTHFQIDVQTPQSQGSGTGRQYIVTVKDVDDSNTPAAPPVAAAAPVEAAAKAAPMSMALIPSTPMSVPAVAPAAASSPAPAAVNAPRIDRSKMSADDVYWSEQPPAVQALRYMPDDERYTAALDLAKQGHTIDVPIMVWNWDPLKTMIQRQVDGYTWVPSGLQPNVALGPGLSFPGLDAYDAKNPPAGSIKVTTDFAMGTRDQATLPT